MESDVVIIKDENIEYFLNIYDELNIIEYNNENNEDENFFNKINEKIKLPEANIQIIDNNYSWLTIKQIKNYSKLLLNSYIKHNHEKLDDDIEYDIDEEDIEWLKLINKKRKREKLNFIKKSELIFIMNRLEKESYIETETYDEDKNDAICIICLDDECFNSNVILFCDMCNLTVHQECYGVPYIPEGQWLCKKCIKSPNKDVECVLCPSKYGAFKQTDDNRWAHSICAMWIPEVHFLNVVFLEPITGIDKIVSARWKLICYICKKRNQGACIQCDKKNCYKAFHVTCAQEAGLYMKIQDQNNDVKRMAYCNTHTPNDFKSPKLRMIKYEQLKHNKNIKKVLCENQTNVLMPKINENTKINLLNSIQFDNKTKYLKLIINYWLLKRKLRSGVPLIKRLQISHLI